MSDNQVQYQATTVGWALTKYGLLAALVGALAAVFLPAVGIGPILFFLGLLIAVGGGLIRLLAAFLRMLMRDVQR